MTEVKVLAALAILGLIGMAVAAYFDNSFLQNFWPNFFSDFFVGILIAGLVSWLLSRSRTVEAKVLLQVSPTSESELSLDFLVENFGRTSFHAEEIYWHVYVDSKFAILDKGGETPEKGMLTIADRRFVYFRNLLRSPVFPERKARLFTIKVAKPETGEYRIYYYLSTAHGLFPRSIKKDKEGNLLPATYGKLTITIQN